MQGFLTVCAYEGKLKRTVPFSFLQTVLLPFQPQPPLCFSTVGFCCKARSISVPDNPYTDLVEITAYVESDVKNNCAGSSTQNTLFKSCICVPLCLMPIHFNVCQYHAFGDGIKRIYTNADQTLKYGYSEIPDPRSILFYRLFVNGVLQPDATYLLKKGQLEFLTDDVPLKGQPITLLFARLNDCCRNRLSAETNYYVTASDGVKTEYTNADEWMAYGGQGIPDPNKVTCWNLFVNGVLQPQATYEIEEGSLKLCQAPPKGAFLILESMRVLDSFGKLLKGLVNQFVAYSKGHRLFTNQDAEAQYDSSEITLPALSSYQNVFVNGVVQPTPTYQIENDCLSFCPSEAPLINQPVTQQSVSIYR